MKFDRYAPVGVFDSGIGGLSVLQHIRRCLPNESLLYFADSGFAPYGDKPKSAIIARCLAVADFLVTQNIKALVVACNTATAAAIHVLRQRYPTLIIIGIEPGLKPATQQTKSKIVGVLATQATLQSEKFRILSAQLTQETGVSFISSACIGLANQIEKGELRSAKTVALVRQYVLPLLEQGADTLVLGCTHYPFATALIQKIAAENSALATSVQCIDTGLPVALHLQHMLEQRGISLQTSRTQPDITAYTTGSKNSVRNAFNRLLKVPDSVLKAYAISTLTQ